WAGGHAQRRSSQSSTWANPFLLRTGKSGPGRFLSCSFRCGRASRKATPLAPGAGACGPWHSVCSLSLGDCTRPVWVEFIIVICEGGGRGLGNGNPAGPGDRFRRTAVFPAGTTGHGHPISHPVPLGDELEPFSTGSRHERPAPRQARALTEGAQRPEVRAC